MLDFNHINNGQLDASNVAVALTNNVCDYAVATKESPTLVMRKSISKYGSHNPVPALDEAKMISFYQNGNSTTEIAREFGTTHTTILSVLKKNSITPRRRWKYQTKKLKPWIAGHRNHSWKGGVATNKEYRNAQNRGYKKLRSAADPIYKLQIVLRARHNSAFKAFKLGKRDRTVAMLGADWSTIAAHMEGQFAQGMTWSNHGNGDGCWHIDHRKPLCTARTEAELLSRFHYKNLRPLWKSQNLQKRVSDVLLKKMQNAARNILARAVVASLGSQDRVVAHV